MSLGPTPLVPLPSLGPGVYAKLEYLHPSGSIKHRSIPRVLDQLRRAGQLPPGREIVIHSAGSAAVTTAWAGARMGCSVHAVLPRSCAEGVERKLRWLGATCSRKSSREADGFIATLVERGAYRLDQQREPSLVDHYRVIADELLTQMPRPDAVVAGIGTGASISGIARGLRARASSCWVLGVEPQECRIAAGEAWAPHQIPGLAPPFPQPLLARSLVDEFVGVPSASAWARARELARTEGLLVCPASGACVEAALRLRRQRGWDRVVAILSGAIDVLLGSQPELDQEPTPSCQSPSASSSPSTI